MFAEDHYKKSIIYGAKLMHGAHFSDSMPHNM